MRKKNNNLNFLRYGAYGGSSSQNREQRIERRFGRGTYEKRMRNSIWTY